jgi:hypothetical protein
MDSNAAYIALSEHFRDVVALGQISGFVGLGSRDDHAFRVCAQRSEWMSVLEKLSTHNALIHALQIG